MDVSCVNEQRPLSEREDIPGGGRVSLRGRQWLSFYHRDDHQTSGDRKALYNGR